MNAFLRLMPGFTAGIVGLFGLALGASNAPRWDPVDLTFTCAHSGANPFAVAFRGDVTGPGGVHYTTPGFFDGNGTWKLRISPTAEGEWRVVTHSDVPELEGQQRSFDCGPNDAPYAHGGVRIDPEHPHQFRFEDGTHFFPVGYECDWLWALDASDPKLPVVGPFLDKLAGSGFNCVILDTYAHDTSWRAGKTGPDDYGPPPLFPWGGTNERPDHTRFNLAFWQHYDRVIDGLYRRGIWAHVLIKVYNKQVNWPARRSAAEDLFFRWLIARYAAFPNITWDFSKEANNEPDLAYKRDRLEFLRTNDPYHRLLTVHDDRATYNRGDYNALLDYRTDQQHRDWHDVMQAHLAQHAWPVINAEFGYEQGPQGAEDKTYRVAQPAEEVARRAWEVCLSGGFPVYYYTYTAWDVIRPADSPPGYAYFKHLRDFFAETQYWRLQPLEGKTSIGLCLGETGREYVAFINIGAPFTLRLERFPAEAAATWFNPFTGQQVEGGRYPNGNYTFFPPSGWTGPVVLHVQRASP